jgi:hypothetical protein
MKIKLTEYFYTNHSYTHRYDELYSQVLDLDEDFYCPQANRILELGEFVPLWKTQSTKGT